MGLHISKASNCEKESSRINRFLVQLSILVGTAVCVGCGQGQPTGFVARSGTIESIPYEGMWRQVEGKYELVHLVLLPQNSSGVTVASAGFDRKPKSHGISSYPEGLFSDGKRTITGPKERVFVYKEDHSMVPIPLNGIELTDFAPDVVGQLAKAKVWKDKIRPALEKEAWAVH